MSSKDQKPISDCCGADKYIGAGLLFYCSKCHNASPPKEWFKVAVKRDGEKVLLNDRELREEEKPSEDKCEHDPEIKRLLHNESYERRHTCREHDELRCDKCYPWKPEQDKAAVNIAQEIIQGYIFDGGELGEPRKGSTLEHRITKAIENERQNSIWANLNKALGQTILNYQAENAKLKTAHDRGNREIKYTLDKLVRADAYSAKLKTELEAERQKAAVLHKLIDEKQEGINILFKSGDKVNTENLKLKTELDLARKEVEAQKYANNCHLETVKKLEHSIKLGNEGFFEMRDNFKSSLRQIEQLTSERNRMRDALNNCRATLMLCKTKAKEMPFSMQYVNTSFDLAKAALDGEGWE